MEERLSVSQQINILKRAADAEQMQIDSILKDALERCTPFVENLKPVEFEAAQLALSSMFDLIKVYEENEIPIDDENDEAPVILLALEDLSKTAVELGISEGEPWKTVFKYMSEYSEEVDGKKGLSIDPEDMDLNQTSESAWNGIYELTGEGITLGFKISLDPKGQHRTEVSDVSIDLPLMFGLVRRDMGYIEQYKMDRHYLSQVPTVDGAVISLVITETAKAVASEMKDKK